MTQFLASAFSKARSSTACPATRSPMDFHGLKIPKRISTAYHHTYSTCFHQEALILFVTKIYLEMSIYVISCHHPSSSSCPHLRVPILKKKGFDTPSTMQVRTRCKPASWFGHQDRQKTEVSRAPRTGKLETRKTSPVITCYNHNNHGVTVVR